MRVPVVPMVRMRSVQVRIVGMWRVVCGVVSLVSLVTLETEHPPWGERGVRHGQAVIGERWVPPPATSSAPTAQTASQIIVDSIAHAADPDPR